MESRRSMTDSRVFYEHGNFAQYEYVLSHYREALEAKCDTKKKPGELKKLDNWFQDELPRIVSKRSPDKFFTHDELVQCIKWKLARGKFRSRLKELVQMNTPRVVLVETKKAFRQLSKKNDIQGAIQALSNLKGVGPAFASAVLTVMAPEKIPFMADECLMVINNAVTIDYTVREYMQFVDQVNAVCERLNKQGNYDFWTPHRVELTLWSHYVLSDVNSKLLDELDSIPLPAAATNGKDDPAAVDGGAPNVPNVTSSSAAVEDEDSRSSAPIEENGFEATASSASSVEDESSRDSAGKVGSPKEVFAYHGENGEASNDSGFIHPNEASAVLVSNPGSGCVSEEDSHSSLSDLVQPPPAVAPAADAPPADSSSDANAAPDLDSTSPRPSVADPDPEADAGVEVEVDRHQEAVALMPVNDVVQEEPAAAAAVVQADIDDSAAFPDSCIEPEPKRIKLDAQ